MKYVDQMRHYSGTSDILYLAIDTDLSRGLATDVGAGVHHLDSVVSSWGQWFLYQYEWKYHIKK